MNTRQLNAIKRIVSKRGKKLKEWSFANLFVDKNTGKLSATDSYVAVVFDSHTDSDIEKFVADDKFNFIGKDSDKPTPNMASLFDKFNRFWNDTKNCDGVDYSNGLVLDTFVTDVVDEAKRAKKNGDKYIIKFGTGYNPNYMRNVCEAIGNKGVSLFFPVNGRSPIFVMGEYGIGLIMPVNLNYPN